MHLAFACEMAKNQLKSEKYVSYQFSARKHSVEWIVRFLHPVKSGDILKAFILVGIHRAVQNHANRAAPVRTVSMPLAFLQFIPGSLQQLWTQHRQDYSYFLTNEKSYHVQMLSHAQWVRRLNRICPRCLSSERSIDEYIRDNYAFFFDFFLLVFFLLACRCAAF